MLTIVTEQSDTNWLRYILDEFIRIQNANFNIQISTKPSEEGHNLFYLQMDAKQPAIPNMSDNIGLDIIWLDKQTYCLKSSQVNAGQWLVDYDIFWSAFVFLSRLEEYKSAEAGNLIESYCSRHPRAEASTFETPIVNILFDKLEKVLVKAFPNLSFDQGPKPNIELSHDLDYINKTFQLLGKQTAFNLFNSLKSVTSPRQLGPNISKTLRFLFKSPSYWIFDYWSEFEKSINKTSTFYIYAADQSHGFKSWLIDPSYRVSSNKKLQSTLKELHNQGHSIGLHGSYFSALDYDMLSDEKHHLEESVGLEVKKTRQHWLRYFELSTPQIHEKLFEEDSTVGWNEQMGFRAGIASRYRPYDHENKRPFDHWILPQIIMDSQLFDYNKGDLGQAIDRGKILLDRISGFKNVNCSLSWHPRTASSDYNWHPPYEELAKYL